MWVYVHILNLPKESEMQNPWIKMILADGFVLICAAIIYTKVGWDGMIVAGITMSMTYVAVKTME